MGGKECRCIRGLRSCTKAVDGATLTLKGVDNVHSGNGLATGVLGVGDGVTDNAFEEALEDLIDFLLQIDSKCIEYIITDVSI